MIGGVSIPDFWLGTLLVLLFSATLVWLPPSGYTPFTADPLGNLRYMILPVTHPGDRRGGLHLADDARRRWRRRSERRS